MFIQGDWQSCVLSTDVYIFIYVEIMSSACDLMLYMSLDI